MDQTVTATPATVSWYSLGPSRSAKRSLFSAGNSRRPDPVVYQEMTSSEQSADDENWDRHCRGRPSSQFNRSMSMHVRSSRSARKSCNGAADSSCQLPYNTSPRMKADRWKSVGPDQHSAAPEFSYHAVSRASSTQQNENTAATTGNELNALYGTPTRRPRHRPTKSASAHSDADRLPPKPLRAMRRPSATDVEFSLASSASPMSTVARHLIGDQKCIRLETALRDRDDELRELRQTIELNERALLKSLDDERQRWTAERQRLQADLLTVRRYGLPASRSAFRCPSADRALAGERVQTAAVVVVEPSQRPQPAVRRGLTETAVTTWSTVTSVDVPPDKSDSRAADVGHCDTSEISLPVEIDSGNISPYTSKNDDFEVRRQSSVSAVDFVGSDDTKELCLQLELCRQEFANERRRWANEKRVVVEYQLRLQRYCRQLADRNQLLEERLKTMSLELGRNGGSSGYSSDSAALVVQFLDDDSLLTSSL